MKVLMISFQIPIAQGSMHWSLKHIILGAKLFSCIFLEEKKYLNWAYASAFSFPMSIWCIGKKDSHSSLSSQQVWLSIFFRMSDIKGKGSHRHKGNSRGKPIWVHTPKAACPLYILNKIKHYSKRGIMYYFFLWGPEQHQHSTVHYNMR